MTTSIAESESGGDLDKEVAKDVDKEASQNILQVS